MHGSMEEEDKKYSHDSLSVSAKREQTVERVETLVCFLIGLHH